MSDDDVEFHAWSLRRPGGQHVGPSSWGVLAVHPPTGVAVVETSERSQYRCRIKAIARLQSLLSAIGYED